MKANLFVCAALVAFGILFHFVLKLKELEDQGTIVAPWAYWRSHPYTSLSVIMGAYLFMFLQNAIGELTHTSAILTGIACNSVGDKLRAKAMAKLNEPVQEKGSNLPLIAFLSLFTLFSFATPWAYGEAVLGTKTPIGYVKICRSNVCLQDANKKEILIQCTTIEDCDKKLDAKIAEYGIKVETGGNWWDWRRQRHATYRKASVPPVVPPNAALLEWTPPSVQTDGKPLTTLNGYRIYYGLAPNEMTEVIHLTNPGVTHYLIENLAPGTYYFGIAATTPETESTISARKSKTIT